LYYIHQNQPSPDFGAQEEIEVEEEEELAAEA
jgi:hypothetical protein